MNCQDFEKLAPALARDRPLDATAREQGVAHTEVCEKCAARVVEELALLAGVRVVVAEMAREEAPARVEAALLAAFREQTTAAPTVIPIFSRASRWSSWRLAAVAAGILLLISVTAIFWWSASSLKPQQGKQAVLPGPGASPTPPKQAAPPVGSDQVAVEQPKNPPKRGRRRAPMDSSDEAEVVTPFFSLREGEDITELETLQLVRVELPGSALGEVGLPVDPETANEPVKADVVLGQDGLARAIRFVR